MTFVNVQTLFCCQVHLKFYLQLINQRSRKKEEPKKESPESSDKKKELPATRGYYALEFLYHFNNDQGGNGTGKTEFGYQFSRQGKQEFK